MRECSQTGLPAVAFGGTQTAQTQTAQNSLLRNILPSSPCGSRFCPARHTSILRKPLKGEILRIWRKKFDLVSLVLAQRSRPEECSTRPGQTLAVVAVRLGVGNEIFARQIPRQVRHFIPHRLRLFQIRTVLHRTFSAGLESLGLAAAARFALEAGVKQFVVRPETSATGNVHRKLIEPVDPLPCGHRALLMCQPLGLAMVSRTIGTQYAARRDHLRHVALSADRSRDISGSFVRQNVFYVSVVASFSCRSEKKGAPFFRPARKLL